MTYQELVEWLAFLAHTEMLKVNNHFDEPMDGDQTRKLSADFLHALNKLNGNSEASND